MKLFILYINSFVQSFPMLVNRAVYSLTHIVMESNWNVDCEAFLHFIPFIFTIYIKINISTTSYFYTCDKNVACFVISYYCGWYVGLHQVKEYLVNLKVKC